MANVKVYGIETMVEVKQAFSTVETREDLAKADM